jgi:hypothetical protein
MLPRSTSDPGWGLCLRGGFLGCLLSQTRHRNTWVLLQRVADALLLEARLCDAGLGPQPVVGWWRLPSASQERPKVRLILGSAIGQPHADVSACFGDCLRHKRRGSVASAAGGHTHACMSDAHGAQAIAGSGGSNERPSPSEPNACGGGECGATPREHPPCVARSIGMSPHCAPQSGFQSQGNRRMNACLPSDSIVEALLPGHSKLAVRQAIRACLVAFLCSEAPRGRLVRTAHLPQSAGRAGGSYEAPVHLSITVAALIRGQNVRGNRDTARVGLRAAAQLRVECLDRATAAKGCDGTATAGSDHRKRARHVSQRRLARHPLCRPPVLG